jgi:hypothetical protein
MFMEKIVVGTYEEDFTQFEIFCYCLNKNWKGNKQITVFVGSYNNEPGNIDQVHATVDLRLPSWNVEVVNGHQPLAVDGYAEQNINKIVNSFDSDHAIVFDSKDFMVRSMDLTDFMVDDCLALSYFETAQTHYDLYPASKKIFDNLNIPTTLNLTPWIWDSVVLKNMWNKHHDGFYKGHYTEWDSYLTYAVGTNSVKLPSFKERVIVSGGWTHQDYDGMLAQKQQVIDFDHKKIWKHSRKLEDPRCSDVTNQVLSHFDIPLTI